MSPAVVTSIFMLVLLCIEPICGFVTFGNWNSARMLTVCPPFEEPPPNMSMSPFYLARDHENQTQFTTILPLSLRTFTALGMVLLENNQLCLRGKVLSNFLLPNRLSAQFQMLTGVAIWFSPCLQRQTLNMRKNCFKIQRMEFEKLDWNEINSLYELLVKFLETQNS